MTHKQATISIQNRVKGDRFVIAIAIGRAQAKK
jgi:hypothetical protein